jgi:hypothetical protein
MEVTLCYQVGVKRDEPSALQPVNGRQVKSASSNSTLPAYAPLAAFVTRVESPAGHYDPTEQDKPKRLHDGNLLRREVGLSPEPRGARSASHGSYVTIK